jgi:hypothetical protein
MSCLLLYVVVFQLPQNDSFVGTVEKVNRANNSVTVKDVVQVLQR